MITGLSEIEIYPPVCIEGDRDVREAWVRVFSPGWLHMLRGQETLCFLWDPLSSLHSHWFYSSLIYSCCFICARAHIVNTTEQINRYKYNKSGSDKAVCSEWLWCLGIIRCNQQNGRLFCPFRLPTSSMAMKHLTYSKF